jgi:TetR/AcrR family transcriptional repressor of nem operon
MKTSRTEAAEARQRMVRAAADRFRRDGIAETGLAGFVPEAGLTAGGSTVISIFKDASLAEARERASEAVVGMMLDASARRGSGSNFETFGDDYLSAGHRDGRRAFRSPRSGAT